MHKQIFIKSPVALCILDSKSFIVKQANHLFYETAKVQNDIIGHSFLQLLTASTAKIVHQKWLTIFDEANNEVEIVFNTKKTFYILSYQPIINDIDGTNEYIIAIKENVAKYKVLQEKMLHKLLMTAPGIICTLTGPKHIYTIINNKYQQLFGKRQLLNFPLMQALPELEGQGIDILLDAVYNTGVPYMALEVPVSIAKDVDLLPEIQYFNLSFQPMFNEEESINGILVFGYEVTEQVIAKNKNIEDQQILANTLKQKVDESTNKLRQANAALELKNEQLQLTNNLLNKNNNELFDAKEKLFSEYARNLIEATLDPLITIDNNGIITDVNEAMVKATDKKRVQLIGSDFKLYFIEQEKCAEMFKNVFKKEQVINYHLSIIDGEITDVLVNASTYKNEQQQVLGAVLVARDITQMKKIELQLTDAKLFAEEATRQAQEATHVAEIAVESKQQFLSNMSHEIRTPMNAIIGFTKVMLKTELTAKQKEFVDAIKTSGDAMIVLINDILDLAKVNAGKMTFEETPFKLATSVSAMLHLFETKMQEKNLSLVIDYDKNIPEVMLGDPRRLHQIILNLLSNAVKFTNKGTITVSAKLVKEDDATTTIQFSINDTGIGISNKEIDNIFENFQQATQDTTKLYGGTGLGLAIVKQLVETQGGTIEVTSEINKGSNFRFTLSFKKTDINDVLEINGDAIDVKAKNIKVLVVEDMLLNQLLMRTVLEDFGFECVITDNGKLAIEQLQQNNYDVVLMDLQMPEMNGFEATTYIRETLQSTIPIIALTADVTTMDVAKCKAIGMNDYIAKPIDEDLLYNKIIAVVKKPIQQSIATNNNTDINLPFTTSCINLTYLNKRTKSNPALLAEIIAVYLEQTPSLLTVMKASLISKDWELLQATIHKMIPSFSIMGFDNSFEQMAKQIQAYAVTQLNLPNIHELIFKIDKACVQACTELAIELKTLKN